MSIELLLTGGVSRLSSRVIYGEHVLEEAEIATVDWESEKVASVLRYKTPQDFRADELSHCNFGCATVYEDKLYTCTPTEVFVFQLPGLEVIRHFSHPLFNDVHHARVVAGKIYVVSTGIDAVAVFDEDGRFERVSSVFSEDVWSKFPEGTDFRKMASTKPHQAHPNFLFDIDGEPWATRFNQMDAVSLVDPSRSISIGVERVHDGVVGGDFIYFTCVNGHIVVANKRSLKVEEVLDLNAIDGRNFPLGWCRGVCVEGDLAYVGFSKLRHTKLIKNLQWLRSRLRGGDDTFTPLEARVVCFDLVRKQMVKEVEMPAKFQSAIFSVNVSPSGLKVFEHRETEAELAI